MPKYGDWDIIYRRAYNEAEGSYFFPEKLGPSVLENIKRVQGSYMFANQYQNEIIPADAQTFKKEWIKYYNVIPEPYYTFITVDPALSEADTSDSTGVVVVSIDINGVRYVRAAERVRCNPTALIQKLFDLNDMYKPLAIGIEAVAYQKALVYFMQQEMLKRNAFVPIQAIKHQNDSSKEMRILKMVPRFEWNGIFLNNGLHDLEKELMLFPRGAHDDLIDALQMIDNIAAIPKQEIKDVKPAPGHPDYEKWFIQNIHKTRSVNSTS